MQLNSGYTMFGHSQCTYCVKAKALFMARGIPFEYKDVREDDEAREFIVGQGLKTVPQIYLGDTRIGGYDDLCNFLDQKIREDN